MIRPARFFLPLVLLAACAAPAFPADSAAVAAARRALRAAVSRSDADALLKARARFLALSSAEPDLAVLHGWVAVADWRVAPLLLAKDRTQAERYAKDGLEHLEAALKLDERCADCWALKAGLHGFLITFDPASGMTLGPQTMTELGRAQGIAPNNPRVWLLDGINTLHMPVAFGGGPARALDKLRRAQELFAAGPDSGAFDWGREDAWIWAGRVAAQQHDYAAADSCYAKVLALDPDNAWVKQRLLPELNEARAKQEKQP